MSRRERLARWFWRTLALVLFCSWQGHDYRGFFAGLECDRCGHMTPGVRVDEARAARLAASRARIDEWYRRARPTIRLTIRVDNQAGRQMDAIIRRLKSKEGAA